MTEPDPKPTTKSLKKEIYLKFGEEEIYIYI